ncbi:hypothetical protein GCM10011369_34890 [Neiella marina]|uniref:DUF3019 domain-containing protein n=1 Tax=Neiella marina TaxID=508461 RepID=A0A8J2UAI8_9GAMM|nr:DUF3019 domain-containing protein [Neiella marina]GGA89737.1 hypothetical protein GCM10011369_34890 [Neiella marina]
MVVLTGYRFVLLAIVSCFASASVFANTGESNGATDDSLNIELNTEIPTLQASPALCELVKGQSLCEMNLTLIWETPRAGHFCLWDSQLTEPLRCWRDDWSGTHALPFSSEQDRTYWLTRGPDGSVAAQTTVAITWALEQRLRAKRRRAFWRVF